MIILWAQNLLKGGSVMLNGLRSECGKGGKREGKPEKAKPEDR